MPHTDTQTQRLSIYRRYIAGKIHAHRYTHTDTPLRGGNQKNRGGNEVERRRSRVETEERWSKTKAWQKEMRETKSWCRRLETLQKYRGWGGSQQTQQWEITAIGAITGRRKTAPVPKVRRRRRGGEHSWRKKASCSGVSDMQMIASVLNNVSSLKLRDASKVV